MTCDAVSRLAWRRKKLQAYTILRASVSSIMEEILKPAGVKAYEEYPDAVFLYHRVVETMALHYHGHKIEPVMAAMKREYDCGDFRDYNIISTFLRRVAFLQLHLRDVTDQSPEATRLHSTCYG